MRRVGGVCLWVLWTGVALAAPRGEPPGWIESWVAPADARITPGGVPETSAAEAVIRVARGERAGFFVVVRSDDGVGEVSFEWGEPRSTQGTLSKEALRVWKGAYRDGKEATVDALVPLGARVRESSGLRVEELPGENVPFFVEVAIPPGALPGRYETQLRLNVSDTRQLTVPVQIEVVSDAPSTARNAVRPTVGVGVLDATWP